MLTLQNNTQAVLDLPGIQTPLIDAGQMPTKFDLPFGLGEVFGPHGRPAGLRGGVTFAADLFDRVTVEDITRRCCGYSKPSRPTRRPRWSRLRSWTQRSGSSC